MKWFLQSYQTWSKTDLIKQNTFTYRPKRNERYFMKNNLNCTIWHKLTNLWGLPQFSNAHKSTNARPYTLNNNDVILFLLEKWIIFLHCAYEYISTPKLTDYNKYGIQQYNYYFKSSKLNYLIPIKPYRSLFYWRSW